MWDNVWKELGYFCRAIWGDMIHMQVHTLTASYTYIYIYMYIYTYIHIYICRYIHSQLHTYTFTFIFTCTSTLHLHYIYIYIYIYIHTCIYTCTRHCVSVCWRVCVCVCVFLSEDTQIVRPSICLLTYLYVRLSFWTVSMFVCMYSFSLSSHRRLGHDQEGHALVGYKPPLCTGFRIETGVLLDLTQVLRSKQIYYPLI